MEPFEDERRPPLLHGHHPPEQPPDQGGEHRQVLGKKVRQAHLCHNAVPEW